MKILKVNNNLFFFTFFKKPIFFLKNKFYLTNFFSYNFFFFKFFRNFFNLTANVVFFACLYKLHTVLLNIYTNNKNMYIVNNNEAFNCNLLNYNYFNKNFFFLFFKFSWLKLEKNKNTFLFLLNQFNVRLIFFFDFNINSHLSNFFFNQFFLTTGLVKSSQFNKIYDYPIYYSGNKILHTYIIYLFLNKFFLQKKNFSLLKFNLNYYNFLLLN